MTNYINVKLYEERFKPLIEFLKAAGADPNASNAESIGKCIFGIYSLFTEKDFDGKTAMDLLREAKGETWEAQLLDFERKYSRFLQDGIKKDN